MKFWDLNGNVKINRLKCCKDQNSVDVLIHNCHSTNANNLFFQTCKHIQVLIFHPNSELTIPLYNWFRVTSTSLNLVDTHF